MCIQILARVSLRLCSFYVCVFAHVILMSNSHNVSAGKRLVMHSLLKMIQTKLSTSLQSLPLSPEENNHEHELN